MRISGADAASDTEVRNGRCLDEMRSRVSSVEKMEIVRWSSETGISVEVTAQMHNIDPNLILRWMRMQRNVRCVDPQRDAGMRRSVVQLFAGIAGHTEASE